VLRRLGAQGIPVTARAGSLSTAQKQLLEIGRAMALDAPLIIMDEPTASLPDRDADRLLELVDDDRDLVDRVRAKLRREPVEDLRIDFEDGYGTRSDEDEDGDVRRAAAGFDCDGLASASGQLRTYVERRDSGVLDEPATARALADFLLRGIDCGALSQTEVAERSGLDAHRLAGLAHRATETGGSGR
jgi:hypothetical protein